MRISLRMVVLIGSVMVVVLTLFHSVDALTQSLIEEEQKMSTLHESSKAYYSMR